MAAGTAYTTSSSAAHTIFPIVPGSSIENAHARGAQSHYLIRYEMRKTLLGLVSLKPLEAEARQVAGSGGDAAQGHSRHALDRIGCDEGAALEHVLGQTHVADRRIISVGQYLQEVVVLSKVLLRVMRHLRGTQRHLRLQEGCAIGLGARVVQRNHVRLVGQRPEGDEGSQKLGVGAGDGHVALG